MIAVPKRYGFPAAHVLASRELSPEENEAIFGPCANPNGHGHNYGVEVTVTGPIDPDSGQVVPEATLDEIYQAAVAEPFSHRLLNDLEDFATRVPTAENIAVAIHDRLASAVRRSTRARLLRVRIVETPRNSCVVGEVK